MNFDFRTARLLIQLFSAPGAFVLIGLVGMVWSAEPSEVPPLLAGVIAPILRAVFLGGTGFTAIGLTWATWNCWQLYRWETGSVVGSCTNCGGLLSHRDGRYGAYSVCKMCGAKRNGWH